jgi:DNA mismatch repair protein MutL
MLINAIKNALTANSHRVSTTNSTAALNYFYKNQKTNTYLPSVSSNNLSLQEEPKNRPTNSFVLPTASIKTDYSENATGKQVAANQYSSHQADQSINNQEPINRQGSLLNIAPDSIFIEEDRNNAVAKDYPLGAAKTQLYNTYIISQTSDGIIITDQHAAHERLGYEKIKAQIQTEGLTKQRLLIPEIVDMPDAARAEVINEYKQVLADLGLTIEKFGDRSIIISELPALLGDIDASKLILDIADHLIVMGEDIALAKLIESVTETYACYYAIRAGRALSAVEMNGLLRQMEKTPFSGQCNHGRPTYIELKLTDIEKLFGRR